MISDLTLLASQENLEKGDVKSAEAAEAAGRSEMSAISGSAISGISFVTQGQPKDDGAAVRNFFLADSRSSKSTQDCAWQSGRLQHMIQWIPATRGTWQRPRVHMRIREGSLMR